MVTRVAGRRAAPRTPSSRAGTRRWLGDLVRRTRPAVLAAATLVVGALVLGTVVGWSGLGQGDPGAALSRDPLALLGHNLLIAALAASGLVTFGLGTLLAGVPSWFLVGTQVGASALLHGGGTTARGLVAHGALELAGFVLATAIGLLPLVHTAARLTGAGPGRPPAPTVRRRLADAVALAVAAAALLTAGAVLEATATPALLGT